MANAEHVGILKEGVETWNQWREDNADTVPDLAGAHLGFLDLRNANLTSVDLTGTNLTAADLTNANLRKANLQDANFAEAKLGAANFQQFKLAGVCFNRADLRRADFSEADLCGADLSGALLTWAQFIRADLRGANLSLAHLLESNFFGALLMEADLRSANLTRASLVEANLTRANLEGTDFRSAKLLRADLSRANLYQADLIWAKVNDADLWGAVLVKTRLQGTSLVNVRGLSSRQLVENRLGGANLESSGIEEEYFSASVSALADSSRRHSRFHMAVLAVQAYVALTVGTQPEALAAGQAVALPLTGLSVEGSDFLWAASILVTALSAFFLMNLRNHWISLRRMPGVFPDGAPMEARIHSWYLNAFGKVCFRGSVKRTLHDRLRFIVGAVLAYLLSPFLVGFMAYQGQETGLVWFAVVVLILALWHLRKDLRVISQSPRKEIDLPKK